MTMLENSQDKNLKMPGFWLTPSCTQIEPTEGRREKRKAFRASIGRQDVAGCLAEQVTMENQKVEEEYHPQLTLFAADFHASLLVRPGSDAAKKMTVTSGLNISGLYKRSDPSGLLAKTCLESSVWASTKCFLTWRVKATPARRLLFQLVPSMPRTEEIESGLLPTMRSGLTGNIHPNRCNDKNRNLEKVLSEQMWPTPTQDSATDRSSKYAQGGTPLAMAVKLWPTPTRSDYKGSGPTNIRKDGKNRKKDRLDYAVEEWYPTPTAPGKHQVGTIAEWGGAREQISHAGEYVGENWSVEPSVGRVAHGIPNRVDRLKQLGNAVVPQVVEVIGRAIMEVEKETA